MGVRVTVECDSCKTIKQETNHWYMVRFSDAANRGVGMLVEPFNAAIAQSDDRYHVFCGESCVTKFVSENLKELW